MPQRTQHNVDGTQLQEQIKAEQCWKELVEQKLPANLEAQARALGAFQRKRALESAQTLLRALLSYVLSLSSLKQLSGWSRLLGLTPRVISAPAWHKRLQNSSPWLLWIGSTLLALRLETRQMPQGQRLLLVDATHLAEMGPKADTWSLHCAYNLLTSSLAWVQVTDQHQGESFRHIPIQPGDILVADGAYSRASQLLAVHEAQAFCLTRFSPVHLPVYAALCPQQTPAFRLDVPGWLAGLRPGSYQRQGVVFVEGKRLCVRLIAVVLPEPQAEALRRQKQRQARDKGRKLSEQALFLAGFHLLVTTLPQERWELSLLLELYQARWQIEILFKRFKQVLDTHRLPCHTAQTAQAMIAAFLVAWLLIEDEATELRRQITDAEPFALPISQWQLNQWGKACLQHVVAGWWSPQQLRALIPELRRIFCEKRRRPLREHQRRCRFHLLLGDEPDRVSFFDCSRA